MEINYRLIILKINIEKLKIIQKLFGGILDMKNDELCFCWCFWNIEISIQELSQAKDIVVRAMDE